MKIVELSPIYLGQWIHLRQQMWPEDAEQFHFNEGLEIIESDHLNSFILLNAEHHAVAFADAALRFEYVNGCTTSPVLYLEGVFVEPEWRLNHYAQQLIQAVEAWGKMLGCTEMASDAELDNIVSHHMHEKLGFQMTEKVVFFKKNMNE